MNEKVLELLKTKNKYFLLLFIGVICVLVSITGNDSIPANNIEKKLKSTLEMAEGVGDVDVMLTFDEKNNVEGAIVVADGAVNASVKKVIHDSAVAVLDLPDYKVQVLIKKK